MRARTVVVVLGVVVALSGAGLYGLSSGPSGSLSTDWVSDPHRPNQVNHHPVVVASENGRVDIVAPISSVSKDSGSRCAVTMLDANGSTRWQYVINRSTCAIHGIGDSVVADATGDGEQNVLAPTTENRLYVFDAANGSVEWTRNLTSFGYAGPQVLTKPRRLVVQPDFAGAVFAMNANGTLAWRYDLNETVFADTETVRVTGTPHPSVAVGSTTHVTVFEPNGTVAWRRAAAATWLVSGRVDGEDVLVASGGSNITALAADGTTRWHRTGWNRPAIEQVADGDGDGVPEVYVGSDGNRIAALNARTGETEWTTALSTDANILPAPVTGDVDGDGHPEVVAATNDGAVHVLDPQSGEVVASYERDVSVWVHPTVADIDGDGAAEVLVMYGDGRVVALSYHQ